jgi:hypothetical protein
LQASRWAASSRNLSRSHSDRINRLVILSAVAGRTAEERAKVVDRLALLKTGGIPAVSAAAEDRWFTPEFRQRHPERVARRMRELLATIPFPMPPPTPCLPPAIWAIGSARSASRP